MKHILLSALVVLAAACSNPAPEPVEEVKTDSTNGLVPSQQEPEPVVEDTTMEPAEVEADLSTITEQGRKAAKKAGEALKGQLLTALAEYMVRDAVGYCQEVAQETTQNAGKSNGVAVKRTALKYRNPANKPTDKEKAALALFAGNPKMQELTVDEGTYYAYYKPILLEGECQLCHGKPKVDIADDVLAEIAKRYPNDQATGFTAGDLRGMWSISIPKESQP